MNHAKPLIGIALTGFLVSGCSYFGTQEASLENYNAALSSAKISLAKAKKSNFEWRDSGKMLKQAEAAAKAGDFTKAIKLANKAAKQGELAVQQAESQKNAGPL